LIGIDNTLTVAAFLLFLLALTQCGNDVDVSGEITCIIEKPSESEETEGLGD